MPGSEQRPALKLPYVDSRELVPIPLLTLKGVPMPISPPKLYARDAVLLDQEAAGAGGGRLRDESPGPSRLDFDCCTRTPSSARVLAL